MSDECPNMHEQDSSISRFDITGSARFEWLLFPLPFQRLAAAILYFVVCLHSKEPALSLCLGRRLPSKRGLK